MPEKDFFHDCTELFFAGTCCRIESESAWAIPKYSLFSLVKYFNDFSMKKWKRFTTLQSVDIELMLRGKGMVSIYGIDKGIEMPVRNKIGEFEYSCDSKEQVNFHVPDNNFCMIGMEISTYTDTYFYGGQFIGTFPDTEIKNIELSIATTTCRKEQFIKNNIAIIYNELLNTDKDISKHLKVHIVDNGRTLKPSDFPEDDRIILHENKNVGGSGGYARGMIESINQAPQATHVLLMDDDVVVLPEAIFRTYVILRTLRKEYSSSFISGAMFGIENKKSQHEDVGYVKESGYYHPFKMSYDQSILNSNLDCEERCTDGDLTYAAWWYCCIPIRVISENGFPMPFFVRGDDVEYSLRCNANLITMNGICVWHMGFANKFNVPMNHYQEIRNMFVAKAITPSLQSVTQYRKMVLSFRKHILRFDYDSAELVIRALEDYLKGPQFLQIDQGEKILKENNKLTHDYFPISEFGLNINDIENLYMDSSRGFIKKWFYRFTWNGQKLWLGSSHKRAIVPFDDTHMPGRTAFCTEIICVNPFTETGFKLERNKEKFRETIKHYRNVIKLYKKTHEKIDEDYREQKTYITSLEFWKKYLEM